MSQEKFRRARPWRTSVDYQEERAWVNFYRRVGDPDIAVEVMHQLEADPEMKRAHLALYMQCKETLRKHKARQARDKRIGQAVRSLCYAIFVKPVLAMNRRVHRASDTAVACLPDGRSEPATKQVSGLKQEPEFAQAKSAFNAQDGSVAIEATSAAPPAADKAADKAANNVVKNA
jgi:hypothetical protein